MTLRDLHALPYADAEPTTTGSQRVRAVTQQEAPCKGAGMSDTPGHDPSLTPNLLVISDLHLGEDIKPNSTGYMQHIAILERELAAFLRHYTVERHDGRAWRLIVNGDMIDFLSVCLLPQPGEDLGDDLDPEDHVYGMGARPKMARAKMRKVLERHADVFQAFGGFLAAGNELGIVAGNHDVEFHWPVVQETFREGIGACWLASPNGQLPGAVPRTIVETAISFHPWFYFEEGLVWVEHGHQYDEYCSFDYVLHPTGPKEEIVANVGSAGLRYVMNHFMRDVVHGFEKNGAIGYVTWTLKQGARRAWLIAKGYFAMVWKLLTVWRVLFWRRDLDAARKHGHRQKLRQIAAQFRISEETLGALDGLRQKPAASTLAGLLMSAMVDRVILFAVTVFLLLVVAMALPWVQGLAGAVSVIGMAWGVSVALDRARPNPEPDAHMRLVPERIRRHVQARYVVFGHSHDPVVMPLADGGTYFNTGTWVPAEKPGLLKAFTHLIVRRRAEGADAALYQWHEGGSRVFEG